MACRGARFGDNEPVRFVLIRHGQSGNNLLWAQTGGSTGRHPDAPLTDLGHEQARRLAAAAADGVLPWPVTHLYTSLMTRAVQTAAPLADALDLPLRGSLDIYETSGPYEEDEVTGARSPHPGALRADLLALSTRLDLPDAAGADGWWRSSVEDGWEISAARARRAIAALRSGHDEGDVVALVTHGAFTQHLIRALLGIEVMTGWIEIVNTSICLFEDDVRRPGTCIARRLGWTPHLASDQITE